MKIELYIEPMELNIWFEYAERYINCNSIFETHFNGIKLLQLLKKETNHKSLNIITKLLNCEKQMYDWSYNSLYNIISQNNEIIRTGIIAKISPFDIEKGIIKINTKLILEIMYYCK